jgi:hypothetical protein
MSSVDLAENLVVPLIMFGVYILLAVAVGLSAKKRGRRLWLWTLITLVINPIIGGVILAILPDKSKKISVPNELPTHF